MTRSRRPVQATRLHRPPSDVADLLIGFSAAGAGLGLLWLALGAGRWA